MNILFDICKEFCVHMTICTNKCSITCNLRDICKPLHSFYFIHIIHFVTHKYAGATYSIFASRVTWFSANFLVRCKKY